MNGYKLLAVGITLAGLVLALRGEAVLAYCFGLSGGAGVVHEFVTLPYMRRAHRNHMEES